MANRGSIGDETTSGAKSAAQGAAQGAKAAKKGAKAGAKAAKATAKAGAAAGKAIISSGPVGWIVAGCILFLIVMVMVVGTPATSFNSWTHINEIQDPIDDDELNEDGSVNGFADGRGKAIDAELEGVNLIYKVLKEEEVEAYEELEAQCTANGIDYEATKQFMTKLSSASSGTEIMSYTDNMEAGSFTSDQFDACEILSTYSISVDNLWGKDYLGEGSFEDLDSIDITSTEGKAKYIYVYMRQKHLTHYAACALLGNIEQESGFNPNASNNVYGGHWGLVQWDKGRYARLKKQAKEKGKKPNSFKFQVAFIWWELNNVEKNAFRKLKANDNSLKDATRAIAKHYERCGENEFGNRLGYAKKWEKKFRNMDFSAGGMMSYRGWTGTSSNGKCMIGQALKNYNAPSGDQSGNEVATRPWLKNGSYAGWTHVYRFKDKQKALMASKIIYDACRNNNVGYRKNTISFYKQLKKKDGDAAKIDKKCDAACSQLIAAAVKASGIDVNLNVSAKNLSKTLKASGAFELHTDGRYTRSSKKLQPGDILITLGGSRHAAMVVQTPSGMHGAGVAGNPTSGAAAAAAWAVKTAQDNSFTYGVGSGAHRTGCYYCGTNYGPRMKKKPSSKYKKTYCCNPFVTAAYAHGANDKKLLALCKRGSSCGLSAKSWTKTGVFKSVGKPKMKNLKKGDVLLNSGKHASIYVGEGKRAHAAQEGWSKKTIRVEKLTKSTYNSRVDVVLRYTGHGDGKAPSTIESGAQQINSRGAKGALKWARKIAADNSYVYNGNDPFCHKCVKSRSKAYVCTTFVIASYAHGAKDKEMKKWCKAGSNGIVPNLEAAMKRSKNWKSMGKLSVKEMKPGDVIFWGGRHTELYAGKGKRIGAHGRDGRRAADQISAEKLYGGWTNVMRYRGNGSGTDFKTYKSYHCIEKLGKGDYKTVCKVRGTEMAPTPQGFTYLGDDTYVVAFTDMYNRDGYGNTVRLAKFKNKKRVKVSTENLYTKLKHANGLAYREDNDTLYSVSGYHNKTCYKLDAKTLKVKGSVQMSNAGGSLEFDPDTNRFYLGSGENIRIMSKSLKKSKKKFKKMGQWRYAQDNGGKAGVVYSTVSSYPNKDGGVNRINMYSARTGDYYGSYEINRKGWEIEGCEVDEDGHLLILINIRDSGRKDDLILKTKKALALDEVDSEEASDIEYGEPGNWRYDMPMKLKQYLSGEKAQGNKPLYEWGYVLDKNGEKIPFEGVIDTTTNLEDPKVLDKIVADGTSNVRGPGSTERSRTGGRNQRTKVNRPRPKVETLNSEETKEYEQKVIDNAAALEAANRDIAARAKPELTETTYYMATLKKKDVVKLGMEAYGVTNDKIAELYGPNIDGSDVVAGMAMNSLALLHDVKDFTNPIEAQYGEDATTDEPYEIGKSLGSYEVEVFCGCKRKDCVKKRRDIIGMKKLDDLVEGSSCFVGSKYVKIPKNTIVHNPHYGLLVVEGKIASTGSKLYFRGDVGDGQLAIYGGKNHKRYKIMRNRVIAGANQESRSGVARLNHVKKISVDDARFYTNLAQTSATGGKLRWPLKKEYTITSLCGKRWGRMHCGIDIGAPGGAAVIAAGGGKVVRASWFGGYGNCIDISHGDRLMTRYAHLSKINVSVGKTVRQGQTIGRVGGTGGNYANHLHFETHYNGDVKNPFAYLGDGYRRLIDWNSNSAKELKY